MLCKGSKETASRREPRGEGKEGKKAENDSKLEKLPRRQPRNPSSSKPLSNLTPRLNDCTLDQQEQAGSGCQGWQPNPSLAPIRSFPGPESGSNGQRHKTSSDHCSHLLWPNSDSLTHGCSSSSIPGMNRPLLLAWQGTSHPVGPNGALAMNQPLGAAGCDKTRNGAFSPQKKQSFRPVEVCMD